MSESLPCVFTNHHVVVARARSSSAVVLKARLPLHCSQHSFLFTSHFDGSSYPLQLRFFSPSRPITCHPIQTQWWLCLPSNSGIKGNTLHLQGHKDMLTFESDKRKAKKKENKTENKDEMKETQNSNRTRASEEQAYSCLFFWGSCSMLYSTCSGT